MDFAWLVAIVLLALIFDFLNGVNDSGVLVATMISTGAISPRKAMMLASVADFLGPFIFGVAVATTIGTGIVNPEAISVAVVFAALVSAIAWNILAWRTGMPTSSTHALVGGIVGAAVAARGPEILIMAGLLKIVIVLLVAPILGGLLGYVSLKIALLGLRSATPKVNRVFKSGQVGTSFLLALSHGAMDAQKTMGVITMAFVAAGLLSTFEVQFWVVVLAAIGIALGVFVGGWHTIRTLGAKIYRVRPVHGFTSQASSVLIVATAALLGGPVSVAQVATSAIVGAGAGERVSKVRWGVAGSMITAWLLTLPATALVAILIYKVSVPVLR